MSEKSLLVNSKNDSKTYYGNNNNKVRIDRL